MVSQAPATKPTDHNTSNDLKNALIQLTSGGLAGVISRTSTAPLDRIKILMQISRDRNHVKLNEVVSQIYKEGGTKAFFRGNGTNCLKIGPESAMRFFMYDWTKRQMIAYNKSHNNNHQLNLFERFVAGGIAGAAAQIIVYPLEIVKTRLAASPKGTFHGISDCFVRTWAAGGVRELYRGLLPSLLGIVPYAGIDLALFETMKRKYMASHDGIAPGPLVTLCIGGMSSTVGQLVAYPIALVRTRMQADGLGGEAKIYNGMTDVFRQTFKFEGWKGFYRGIVPNMMKAVPAVSVSWLVFETSKTNLTLFLHSENEDA
eukprot:GDKJ01032517.1.p1 GENE.GDKJ01032517.1~~GDKJ01032517.1.p1  ORF type:complete len:316 (-),score=55.00 GDKJ01032517.1:873-1820(-)